MSAPCIQLPVANGDSSLAEMVASGHMYTQSDSAVYVRVSVCSQSQRWERGKVDWRNYFDNREGERKIEKV